jgi:S-adenosylmethionine hydrolase
VVALLTDFGTRDPFVGVMKGVVLARCPEAALVDLTHEIPPQSLEEAAFWLQKVWPWLPAGTVVVAVVDPGVGTTRRALVVSAHERIFVAPDNGLVTAVAASDPASAVFAVDLDRVGFSDPSATFHGRDVFAPVAAEIAAARLQPVNVGELVPDPVASPLAEPSRTPSSSSGAIVTVDHFGNLISNVDWPLDRPAVVTVAGRSIRLGWTYADVAVGEVAALVNSWGVVEISVRGGSAVAVLGVGRRTPLDIVADDGGRAK